MARDTPIVYHPVDRGWAWMVVLGCTISIFIMGGILRTFGIMIEEISNHFDSPKSVTFLIMSVEGVFYTLAASLGVVLGEKFSARVVLMGAGFVGGAGVALSFFTVSISYLICTLGIGLGIANGFLHGNGLVMVSRYFEKRRSLATGLAVAGGSIGQFVMPPVIQYLLNTYLLSGTLLIMGGIYLNLCVSGWLYRPISFYEPKEEKPSEGALLNGKDKVEEKVTNPTEQLCDKSSDSAAKEKLLIDKRLTKLQIPKTTLSSFASVEDIVSASLVSLSHANEKNGETTLSNEPVGCCKQVSKLKNYCDLSLLKSPAFVYYLITSMLCFVGYFNTLFFIPSHAVHRGFTRYEAAFLISVNGIADLCGRVGCGWFSDLGFIKRYKILAFVICLSGVNSLLLPLADVYWWLALHCAVYGFTCGAHMPLLPVITIDFFGLDMLPNALTILLFLMGAVPAAEQPLLGLMADTLGYESVFYLSGVIALAGSIMSIFFPYIIKPESLKVVSVEAPPVTPPVAMEVAADGTMEE